MYKELEDLLRDEIAKGNIDINGRIEISSDGRIHVYWHPTGKNGATVDLYIKADTVART